jgi:choline transport protein
VTAYDSTIHMIEEMPNPTRQGPRLIIYAIAMSAVTGFGFISAVLFAMDDVPEVISASEPLLTIYYQATNNKAGSICLMMFPFLSFILCAIDDMATSARMAYALARDGGMPFSRYFAHVHPHFGVPVAGLVWCFVWDIIFGLIFLGSSNAFHAIISAAVVCFTITYAIPPGINALRGRRALPKDRSFKLPELVGYICNFADVAWAVLTTVLFVFPTKEHVTPTNMNYCVAAFGVIIVVAGSNWILSARKSYTPPSFTFEDVSGASHIVAPAKDDDSMEKSGQGPKSEHTSTVKAG